MKQFNRFEEDSMFLVERLSVLSTAPAIEKELMQEAREKVGYILDRVALDDFVRDLLDRQDEIISANKRKKRVVISAHLKYSPYILCGESIIHLAQVKGVFIGRDDG